MSNETKTVPVELTKREQWLICQAFRQGYGTGHNDSVESAYNGVCEHEDDGALDWLNDYAADGGVTVADVLCKEAPAPDDMMKNSLASGVVPVRLAAPDDDKDKRIAELKATIKRVSEIPAKLRDDFSRGGMPTGALEAIWYIKEALEQTNEQ